MQAEFGAGLMQGAVAALNDVEEAGLVEREGSWVRLTARGGMASNEVFSRLLVWLPVAVRWCARFVAVEVEDGFGGEEDAGGGSVGGAVGAAGEVDGAGVFADDSLRDP